MKQADKIMKEAVEQLLFDSKITNAQISRETGIGANVIGRYKNGESNIDNMTFANMAKLYNYYIKELEKMRVKITNVLTNSGLRMFALPHNKEEFSKYVTDDNTREIQVIIDESFYKSLLLHSVVMEEDSAWYFRDGADDIALENIKLQKIEHLSTMNNIHEHEYYSKIVGSDTADYIVSKRLAAPYRSF